jgi:Protein of unknown function (DUF1573)
MKKFVFLLSLSFCAFTAFAQSKVAATTTKVTTAAAKVGTAVSAATTKVTETAKVVAAPAAATKGPIMTFELQDKKMNYGTIDQGAEPLRKFKFKNTGTEPLVITNAVGSCGCTVPDWPKKPIMPGESASIDVRYDTQRVGPFTKTITLTTNESSTSQYLTISGEVKEKAKPTSVPAKEDNMLKPVSHK